MVVPLNSAFSSVDGVRFNQSETTLVECPGGKGGGYTIPNTVTNIGDSAFEGCTSLTDVTIPNSVASIGDSAFYGCSSLIGVTIPNSVTSIGDGAFAYCTSLTNVTIPNSVTDIEGYAFYYCSRLSSVYFEGNAPSGDSSVFSADNNATAFYLPGTAGWGSTFGGIPTALWSLPSPLIPKSSVGVRANQFGFTVSWATNVSVVVEASNDLNSPRWSPVKTNALSGGALDFSDLQ